MDEHYMAVQEAFLELVHKMVQGVFVGHLEIADGKMDESNFTALFAAPCILRLLVALKDWESSGVHSLTVPLKVVLADE